MLRATKSSPASGIRAAADHVRYVTSSPRKASVQTSTFAFQDVRANIWWLVSGGSVRTSWSADPQNPAFVRRSLPKDEVVTAGQLRMPAPPSQLQDLLACPPVRLATPRIPGGGVVHLAVGGRRVRPPRCRAQHRPRPHPGLLVPT